VDSGRGNAHPYTHSDAHADSHSYGDANINFNPDTDGHTGSYANTKSSPRSPASPYACAAPVTLML
jgi:hypothetical protein